MLGHLTDTSGCPDNGGQCEACGRRPAVATIITVVHGVCCLARCADCSTAREVPTNWSDEDQRNRAARHIRHLPVGANAQPQPPASRWAR